ncbi:PKD domain-containing protein [Pseudoalteromonas fenneropenaei]|uniref:PKD domain-containing protein n=1 Tax=Pseudoalteromonas fenneropenaei TaxID=1737459 RepID=A0ABV7CMH0_9GAMM
MKWKCFAPSLLALATASCGESGQLEASSVVAVDNTTAVVVAQPTEVAPLIANAGPDVTVKQGDVVSLNGKLSRSQQGEINQYQWRLLSQPAGSATQIHGMDNASAKFVPDVAGEYQLQLAVVDSKGRRAEDQVSVVSQGFNFNSPPAAIILSDKITAAQNESLELDGSMSFDPDFRDVLQYLWQVVAAPEGAEYSLSNTSNPITAFRASTVGEYKVELKVTDPKGANNSSSITLTIGAENQPPIAELGKDRSVIVGEAQTIACERCFDPEGGAISYHWQLLAKPQASLAELTELTTTQTGLLPDIVGDYVIGLVVSDGESSSAPATILLKAQENQQPVAAISPVSGAKVNQKVSLDAAASYDPEGSPLSYNWELIEQPGFDNLFAADTSTPYFTPSQEGIYVVQLVVSDETQSSTPVTVRIPVELDLPPVAKISGDPSRQTTVGTEVTFDGSLSFDPEGSALTYVWALQTPEGSQAQLVTNNAEAKLLPDVAGYYSITLTVTDASGLTSSTRVELHAQALPSVYSGQLVGKITDVKSQPLGNLSFDLNGQVVTTDAQGNLMAELEVKPGEFLTLKTQDPRVAAATYQSWPIDENNFYVNLGNTPVPVMQDIKLMLAVCSAIFDKQPVALGVRLQDTSSRFNHFVWQYEQTFNLEKSRISTLSLPSPANYTLTLPEGLRFVATSSPMLEVLYSPGQVKLKTISICN